MTTVEAPEKTFACPSCGKTMLVRDARIHKPLDKSRMDILKAKLVFFDKDGCVLAKCRNCSRLMRVPLQVRVGGDL